MGDIKTYKLFYLSAKLGSISQAAEALHIERTAAGRRIHQLENYFNKALFIRKHGGVELTPEGQTAFEKVREILTLEESLREQIATKNEAWNLTIASTHSLISTYLPFVLPEFIKANPKIRLNLVGDDQGHLIEKIDFDVGLFPRVTNQPSLIQHELFTNTLGLFSSPEYVNNHGLMQDVSNLSNHRLIVFSEETKYRLGVIGWPLYLGHKEEKELRNSYITVNSVESMIRLAEAGVGVVGISKEIVQLTKCNLENIFPALEQPNITTYLTYSFKKKNNNVIRKLIKFILEHHKKM